MHALLITFTSDAPIEDLAEMFKDYAHGMRSVDGLISKTWVGDGPTLGGFHIFTSREAAESYLGSTMAAGLVANPAFYDFEFRHYDVLDELSAITGTTQTPLAA
jgi:hypothetical protein